MGKRTDISTTDAVLLRVAIGCLLIGGTLAPAALTAAQHQHERTWADCKPLGIAPEDC
jgi:hypothetical protein